MNRPLKVLNLYSGIGGNRKLWNDVEVTAVEYDEQTANVYRHYFPNDNVVVADAHEYLLKNYKHFDFIWSSPPCPSHSKMRMMASKRGDYEPVFPDLSLYQEIIFIDNYFNGKYVIENVVPYYDPLIAPKKIVGRHLFWSNFTITHFDAEPLNIKENKVADLEKMHGFDLSGFSLENKLKNLRNCVHPETGLHILNCARNIITKSNTLQTSLFH